MSSVREAASGSNNWLIHSGIGLYHDCFTLGNSKNGLSGNPPGSVRPTFFNDGSTAGTQNTYPFGFQYPLSMVSLSMRKAGSLDHKSV